MNEKLITAVVWATLIVIGYELYKQFYGTTSTTSSAQLGGGTFADVNQGLSDLLQNLGPNAAGQLNADVAAASSLGQLTDTEQLYQISGANPDDFQY